MSEIRLERIEETSIRFLGEWSDELPSLVQNAWFDAIAMDFKIPDSIRYMEGMSGKKYRYFINNLIGSMKDARYLEIGSYKGSTACSAIYGNTCIATCIDDFSQTWWFTKEDVKSTLEQNLKEAAGNTVQYELINSNFRKIDYSTIGKFNVYMFDGPHEEQDQYDGVVIAQEALDDTFVLIVDDYNLPDVQNGTKRAIKELNLNVVASIEIITRVPDDNGKLDHPVLGSFNSDWHNGYYIAVINKG